MNDMEKYGHMSLMHAGPPSPAQLHVHTLLCVILRGHTRTSYGYTGRAAVLTGSLMSLHLMRGGSSAGASEDEYGHDADTDTDMPAQSSSTVAAATAGATAGPCAAAYSPDPNCEERFKNCSVADTGGPGGLNQTQWRCAVGASSALTRDDLMGTAFRIPAHAAALPLRVVVHDAAVLFSAGESVLPAWEAPMLLGFSEACTNMHQCMYTYVHVRTQPRCTCLHIFIHSLIHVSHTCECMDTSIHPSVYVDSCTHAGGL